MIKELGKATEVRNTVKIHYTHEMYAERCVMNNRSFIDYG